MLVTVECIKWHMAKCDMKFWVIFQNEDTPVVLIYQIMLHIQNQILACTITQSPLELQQTTAHVIDCSPVKI